MAAPIIRSSTDIRRDYNGIEALAKETGQPIYLTKNGRASLVVIDAATFDYDQYVGLMIDEGHRAQQAPPPHVHAGGGQDGDPQARCRESGRP